MAKAVLNVRTLIEGKLNSLKKKLLKALIWSTGLYGADTWAP